MHLHVGRVEGEGERHLEDLLHLAGVGDGAEAGIDQPDERPDGEARHRLVRVEAAQHLDLAGAERDLLLRLAQRRGERRRVARLLLAAGEGDLPRDDA